MKKNEFLNELSKIFEKKINEKTGLDQLNFDSLKVLELISLKESKFKKLKINPDQYLKCRSISEILKLFKIS
jgi:acyl carrier protein|tara:strand:+ start:1318 stop:1533 length:216 start_codon:yes stop_codon:yes gene_type:complete